MAEFGDFHSAVNRIPLLRKKAAGLADKRVFSRDLFSDRAARGHDHLESDHWSGSIDLEMTVRTPLVFGEQATEETLLPGGKKEKRSFVDLPKNDDGTVRVPPTMVKGMLSRAYETLTCSRFRVFSDLPGKAAGMPDSEADTAPLTYRGDAASALRLVPIRICEKQEDGFVCELFYGDTLVKNDYRDDRNRRYPTMRAATLQGDTVGPANLIVSTQRLTAMTPHRKRIRCHLSLCLHGDRAEGARYAYWQVTHIITDTGEIPLFKIPSTVTVIDHLYNVEGYVCRTAPDGMRPNQLFSKKHDERFFFDVSRQGPKKVTIESDVCKAYAAVVRSYVYQRTQDSPRKRHEPNRATRAAQQDSSAAALKVDDLAFAVVDDSGPGPVVLEIVPTMIGRHAYRKSPFRLAQAQGAAPLSTAEEASAADRLFGYVVPYPQENAVRGDVAMRGRVSVGKVDGSRARISRDHKTLTPLLEPKPGSARRFLTAPGGSTPVAEGGQSPIKRSEYFSPGQLLGAAAYPVHRNVLDSRKFPKQATAPAVMNGREQHNANVQLTAKSWVEVGSVLRCTVSFTNLSHDELAALIWVLTPENLVPESEQDSDRSKCGYLRMGLAKPFGLGVLEVRIAEGGLRARRGAGLSDSYATLSGCLGLDDPVAEPSNFTLSHASNLNKTPWVAAMQRAAYGYADDIEVRHMTIDENRENNQSDGGTGEPHPEKGIGPRDMFGPHSAKPIRVG
ncbi:TIGR03986 family CRISPR-associated RAMP protein [Actinomyces sp. 432]|uniref:TIGR03986 family type III CRISPR-associated RAMP protein n=1 Tax=Actinomyces sp. 432 TaxID=2057798 RepID=UPI001373F54B|nr:TIGR03986 family CRISPR-associated RAMP protein [Actinomyces sp. 432]QHO91774.1 TIGR03986 family CRISPR-associated RAMP protein [Actinomyces sp. 432]